MLSPYVLMGSLMQGAGHHSRRRRRWLALGVAALVVDVAGLVGSIWLIAQTIVYGWQTSDWDRLEAASSLPLPFLLVIM